MKVLGTEKYKLQIKNCTSEISIVLDR